MSVQTELQRIIQAKADIVTSIENKGVTVPAGTKIDDLDDYVDQIQQGGGGDTGEYFYIENTTQVTSGYSASFKIADRGNKGSFTIDLEYSTDKTNWQKLSISRTSVQSLTPGAYQKIYLRHKGPIRTKYISGSSLYDAFLVIGANTSNIHYGGELSSLVTGNNNKINHVAESEFQYLFFSGYYIWNQSAMKPYVYLNDDFKLPNCANLNSYKGLFQSTTINHLPSDLLSNTDLAESCYEDMFSNAVMNVSAPALPATTLAKNCYKYMLSSCTNLTTAPALPATTLAVGCYESMFSSCWKLTSIPAILPATTLYNNCYKSMFNGCKAITTTPTLPATTLADYCYNNMFSGCSSLTTAPALPATTLANSCYQYMFQGCTHLTTAPILPALQLSTACYNLMFDGCTNINYIKAMFTTDISSSTSYTTNWLRNVAATGTFVKNANATWSRTDASGIPSGWTVQTETPAAA